MWVWLRKLNEIMESCPITEHYIGARGHRWMKDRKYYKFSMILYLLTRPSHLFIRCSQMR